MRNNKQSPGSQRGAAISRREATGRVLASAAGTMLFGRTGLAALSAHPRRWRNQQARPGRSSRSGCGAGPRTWTPSIPSPRPATTTAAR